MCNECFDGLSNVWESETFLPECIEFEHDEYFELIVKYWEKNKEMIINGINFKTYKGDMAIETHLKSGKMNKLQLSLLLKASKLVKCKISSEWLNQALPHFKDDNESTQLIQTYLTESF